MDPMQILVVEENAPFCDLVMTALAGLRPAPSLGVTVERLTREARLVHLLSCASHRFDVVVCNWDTYFVGREERLQALRMRFPYVSFVVSSVSDSLTVPQSALACGAVGFFRRDSPAELIRQVVGLLLGGEAFVLPAHLR